MLSISPVLSTLFACVSALVFVVILGVVGWVLVMANVHPIIILVVAVVGAGVAFLAIYETLV